MVKSALVFPGRGMVRKLYQAELGDCQPNFNLAKLVLTHSCVHVQWMSYSGVGISNWKYTKILKDWSITVAVQKKYMLFSCYWFCLSEKRHWVWVKSFSSSWKRLEPNSASDVSDVRCVPLWSNDVRSQIVSSVQSLLWEKMFNTFQRNFEFSAFWKNNVDGNQSGTHLTSLVVLGSSLFQDGGNEI